MVKTATGLAALLILAVGHAGPTDDTERLARSLAELVPDDTVSNLEVFEINGFRLESSRNKELGADLAPTGDQFESVIITSDGSFKVAVEKGRPTSSGGGLGIFHRSTGAPMLTAADQSGDGRLDLLTYTVFDEDGETLREIVDYGADGQANLRVHFDQGYAELWHRERWHRIETRDGQRGIEIDGEFRAVERVDNRLSVR